LLRSTDSKSFVHAEVRHADVELVGFA